MKIFVLYISLFLVSCNSTQNTTKPSNNGNAGTSPNNVQQNNMLKDGIDFLAQGSQPTNWKLTINYDDTVRFSADDGLSLKFAYNQLKKSFSPEEVIYTVALKSGMVAINILDKICTVPTIRETYKKEVTVSFNNVVYRGCGSFLADGALNNKWMLEKIGSTIVKKEDYNRLPFFSFDVAAGSLTGNDGCNSVGGKMEVQGKRIKFSDLFSTRMACNKKSIDKIISELISGKFVSYYFKENKLFLYLEDDSLLIFVKGI